jgi:rubrerythrin
MKRTLLALAAVAMLAGAVSATDKKDAPKKPAATTLGNLQIAYNAEANAKARYEAFAVKAESEGYLGVAGLFRAAAFSEGMRTDKLGKAITALGGTPKSDLKKVVVNGTKENLKAAIRTANAEMDKAYPAFLKLAEADKNDQAKMCFHGGMAIVKSHEKLFSRASADLNGWKAKHKVLVCQTCAYTTDDLTLKTCPVCSQPREQFKEFE